MFNVLVCGAGKIGLFVAVLLARSDDYAVTLIDARHSDAQIEALCKQYPRISYKKISVTDEQALKSLLKQQSFAALISCLHSTLNIPLAQAARDHAMHYLNLSEDRETKAQIIKIGANAKTAFVPQCGIAPGLVDIIAQHLMLEFDSLHSATLSVGALPQQVNNSIHYELSWSIDGLVNEYIKPCRIIQNGAVCEVPALSDVETLNLEGETYEMFHTSGGLGTLVDCYENNIKNMQYKTIRYQGHVAAMRDVFAQYNNDHHKIVAWFAEHIPFTTQDVVLMYVCVTGMINNEFSERSFAQRWYPQELDGWHWTAIQWTTASEICAMCDMLLFDEKKYQGLIQHQDVNYDVLIKNRFMQYFKLG